jgi:geranylgeranyl diphosphate synthase type II
VLTLTECLRLLEAGMAERALPEQPAGLYEPVRYILSLGGKRLRPSLALLAAEAVGGDPAQAMGPALAVEWFHNFSLLHDDIMDEAPLRRGKPTVHEAFSSNQAILSGDVMLVQAYQLLAELPAERLPAALALFSRTAVEVCEGQQYDMDFETREDVTEPEYLNMIRLKTAVLLGASLELGAMAAGASEAQGRSLYAFGEALGLAFQLRDDLLDSFGDPARFGKAVGGDIAQDKKTFLLIHALESSAAEDRATLQQWIGVREAARRTEKVEAVKAVYERSGTKAACEEAIGREHARALQALEDTGLSLEQRSGLQALAEKLLARES